MCLPRVGRGSRSPSSRSRPRSWRSARRSESTTRRRGWRPRSSHFVGWAGIRDWLVAFWFSPRTRPPDGVSRLIGPRSTLRTRSPVAKCARGFGSPHRTPGASGSCQSAVVVLIVRASEDRSVSGSSELAQPRTTQAQPPLSIAGSGQPNRSRRGDFRANRTRGPTWRKDLATERRDGPRNRATRCASQLSDEMGLAAERPRSRRCGAAQEPGAGLEWLRPRPARGTRRTRRGARRIARRASRMRRRSG